MRRSNRKEEAEVQTVLICSPHLISEGDEANVQSNQVTQTVATAPPYVPNEYLYDQLQRADVSQIRDNCVRIVSYRRVRKLHFYLPDEESEESSRIDVSDRSTIQSEESNPDLLHQNKQIQTILRVFPHYLHPRERASVLCDCDTQTEVSCEPATSLNEIVPKLRTYFEHTGREMTPGSEARQGSLLYLLKDIIENIDQTNQELFDEDLGSLTSDSSYSLIAAPKKRKKKEKEKEKLKILQCAVEVEKSQSEPCSTCEKRDIILLRQLQNLSARCKSVCKFPEIKCEDLSSGVVFDQCVPCSGDETTGRLKLIKNICQKEISPVPTKIYTPWGHSVEVVQQYEAETFITSKSDGNFGAEIIKNDVTLIIAQNGDRVFVETETNYILSSNKIQPKQQTTGTQQQEILEAGDRCCRPSSGSEKRDCQTCLCNGVKINLCIKNFGSSPGEDPYKIVLDLNLLPGFEKLEVKEIDKKQQNQEEHLCAKDCCPSKATEEPDPKYICPAIMKRVETGNNVQFVEDGKEKNYFCGCDTPDCYCKDEDQKEEKLCEKDTSISKKTKATDILDCRTMSICNLLGGEIMTLVSKNKEGFDVVINLSNPTLQGDQQVGKGCNCGNDCIKKSSLSSLKTSNKRCPCGSKNCNCSVPSSPVSKKRCSCASKNCNCSATSSPLSNNRCPCKSKNCRCSPDTKSLKSDSLTKSACGTPVKRIRTVTKLKKPSICTCTSKTSQIFTKPIVSPSQSGTKRSCTNKIDGSPIVCSEVQKSHSSPDNNVFRCTPCSSSTTVSPKPKSPDVENVSKSRAPGHQKASSMANVSVRSKNSENPCENVSKSCCPCERKTSSARKEKVCCQGKVDCMEPKSSKLKPIEKCPTFIVNLKTESPMGKPTDKISSKISLPSKILPPGFITGQNKIRTSGANKKTQYSGKQKRKKSPHSWQTLKPETPDFKYQKPNDESSWKTSQVQVPDTDTSGKTETPQKLEDTKGEECKTLPEPLPDESSEPISPEKLEFIDDKYWEAKTKTPPKLEDTTGEEWKTVPQQLPGESSEPISPEKLEFIDDEYWEAKVREKQQNKNPFPEILPEPTPVSCPATNVENLNADIFSPETSSTPKGEIQMACHSENAGVPCVPSAHTSFQLPNNTVLNVRLTLDMKGAEEQHCSRSATSLNTGVNPFRTEETPDLFRVNQNQSMLSVGYLKGLNPMYTESSKTINIYPTASRNTFNEHRKSEKMISFSADVGVIDTDSVGNQSVPNSSDKCSSTKSSKRSTKEVESKDVVFMAYKTCEEELKPAFNTLKNIKQELQMLNMPEIDCIFKDPVMALPKNKEKMINLHESASKVTRITITTKDSNVSQKLRTNTKVKFNYLKPTETQTDCHCHGKPRFEVLNSPSHPKLHDKTTRYRYKNPDFSDSGRSTPKIYSTSKIKIKKHYTPSTSSSKSSQTERYGCYNKNISTVKFVTKSKRQTDYPYMSIKICDSKVKHSASSCSSHTRTQSKPKFDSAYCSYPATSATFPTYSKQSVPESLCSKNEKGIQKKSSDNSLSVNASTCSMCSQVSSHVSSEAFVCPARHKSRKNAKRRKPSRCSCTSKECPFFEAFVRTIQRLTDSERDRR